MKAQSNPYENEKENTGENVNLSENGKAILDGFNSKNIKSTKDEKLRKNARDKIYYDVQWGRISDDEADYLFNYFGL